MNNKEKSAPDVDPLVYTKKQLPRVVGLARSTIDGMRRKKEFPEPVVLGGRKVGWPVETVKEWLRSRPAATGIY